MGVWTKKTKMWFEAIFDDLIYIFLPSLASISLISVWGFNPGTDKNKWLFLYNRVP